MPARTPFSQRGHSCSNSGWAQPAKRPLAKRTSGIPEAFQGATTIKELCPGRAESFRVALALPAGLRVRLARRTQAFSPAAEGRSAQLGCMQGRVCAAGLLTRYSLVLPASVLLASNGHGLLVYCTAARMHVSSGDPPRVAWKAGRPVTGSCGCRDSPTARMQRTHVDLGSRLLTRRLSGLPGGGRREPTGGFWPPASAFS